MSLAEAMVRMRAHAYATDLSLLRLCWNVSAASWRALSVTSWAMVARRTPSVRPPDRHACGGFPIDPGLTVSRAASPGR
ncbi:hypothetical protein Cs7R123_44050 [Catellatospora sp. TT07R-123]|nr:hypothetical protein Cs7R123_44050 [Catellatospora sp. TT07R-123]